MDQYDVVIIGGGIVGLATGMALTARRGALRLAILEKESEVGRHQTGHNSGVIHAGIYYKPGSLKAQLCVEGARRMVEFCREQGVAYELCGKVVVASDQGELPALDELYRRGIANGVAGLRRITKEELRDLEPHAAGVAALHSPGTGIVDYGEVARAMVRVLLQRGVTVITGAKVEAIDRDGAGFRLQTPGKEVPCRALVNCAGLHSDVVARMLGLTPGVQIVPFRGEYYTIRPERRHLVRGLIYPVPNPQLPFLGVHLTKMVHGDVEAGPNAVLALAREGYSKTSVNLAELGSTLGFRGFRTLAGRLWKVGAYEYYRSFSKAAFTRDLQKLVPDLRAADLGPGGAGVRAQAVGLNGALIDDFHLITAPGTVHVLNAPSPAATASLAIGEQIAATVEVALNR